VTRVLMVYPEFPDTFWSFKHALRFISKKASNPPLGLLTIAALLPEDWEKRLVDMNTQSLTRQDIEWADYVFVSAMVAQRDSMLDVVKRCKELGATIVAGGPLFLAEEERPAEVDYFVLNEGEITLPEFLRDLEAGTPRRIYSTDAFADMEASPTPMWDLVDPRLYSTMCIQYTRGCPFNCEFCNITAMLGHKVRCKSADQILRELDAIYARGWRGGVFFVDDNFIGNKRKLKTELLPALIAWRQGKEGIAFQTEASVNLVDDPELMDMLVRAGFTAVFVGIETPDEASLAECGKVQNKGRDLVAAVKTMQHAGLEVQGGFIVGFDNDTPSIFQRQIDFIQRSGIVTAMVGLLQAPYGTRLYARLKGEGRLLDEFTGNNTDDTMNFVPKMDPYLLHEGYHRILEGIYAPHAYYQRVRTFLREYTKSGAVRARLTGDEIKALLRSIYVLGIKGKERWEYWRLFFWTLFRRPRLFPNAITFAIYGFHFRRIFETYM
jgi:radical SAM superfamily enzyme YgiQ (UPF0313 family)